MTRCVMRLAAIVVLSGAFFAAAAASEPKPFMRGSMQQIIAEHQGRPLIINFWSTECTYCREELALLSRVARSHPDLRLVLVSTDLPQNAPLVAQFLVKRGFDPGQTWLFADEYAERLRYDIDRKWYGELPRTYLIGTRTERKAVSGKISAEQIERWLAEEGK